MTLSARGRRSRRIPLLAIAALFFNGQISREDAIAKAAYPDKLERLLAA